MLRLVRVRLGILFINVKQIQQAIILVNEKLL